MSSSQTSVLVKEVAFLRVVVERRVATEVDDAKVLAPAKS